MRRKGSCQGCLGSEFRYSLKFVWNNILKRDWKVIELLSVVVRVVNYYTYNHFGHTRACRVASRCAAKLNFRDA